MKLLVVTTDFPPLIGGVATFTRNIAEGLQQAGCSILVLNTVGTNGSREDCDLPVIRTAAMLNKQFLKAAPLLGWVLWNCRRQRPDKLIAMQWTHEGTVARMVKQLLGISYAVVAHGSEIIAGRRRPTRRRLMRHVLHHAERVITNSEFTRGLVMELGIGAERVAVVNPPIAPPLPPDDGALAALDARFDLTGKRVILTSARMVRRKGHAEVIEAMAALRQRYPNLVYLVTGEGGCRPQLEALARRSAVADRVRFVGFVSAADYGLLHQRAEIYVSPSCQDGSDVEGFGLSLAEAASYGKPVIAGRSGGVAEAMAANETGLPVTPGDGAAVVEALRRLLDNEHLRRAMGECGRRWVAQRLAIRRQGEQLKQILQAA